MITIVLLSCFISSLKSNAINPSTGEVENRNDSVLIAYNDLRIVNSKLIELQYQKEINTNLKTIISNDSIIIKKHIALNENISKDYKRAINQRNIFIGTTILAICISLILFVK